MAVSLLEQLSQLVTPDLVQKASTALGENEGGVTRAISAALPIVLGAVASRSGNESALGQLFNLVQDPGNDTTVVLDPARLLGANASASPAMGLGNRLLSTLFGGNVGALGTALAGHAGVRPQSASSLLAVAAPMVLSMLGKLVRGSGLTASSLGSLLMGQRSAIASALPSGLNLERFLAEPARVAPAVPPPVAPAAPTRSIGRWILLALVILAALLLLSRCLKREAPEPEPTTTAPTTEVAPAPAPATETAVPAAPKATLYFDTGAAGLPADATTNLQPVVDYLNANPTAMAVVSGYHDPTGDRAVNEELAKNRATAVRDALVAAGIPEGRIDLQKPLETTGEGSLDAARRVEVTVR